MKKLTSRFHRNLAAEGCKLHRRMAVNFTAEMQFETWGRMSVGLWVLIHDPFGYLFKTYLIFKNLPPAPSLPFFFYR